MFSRDKEKLKSFLGTQSELKGELSSIGILRLDGAVSGKIRADEVILTETAVIQGEITARRIIVGGRAEGVLIAEELLEIRPKGRVQGDIVTRRLVVAGGGKFDGRIEMPAAAPERPPEEAKSPEAKAS